MKKQTYSIQSYDLLEATCDHTFALLPYMHYGPTYELLMTSLHTMLEFVDGTNPDDTNVLFVVERGFVKIVNAMLSLRYFLEDYESKAIRRTATSNKSVFDPEENNDEDDEANDSDAQDTKPKDVAIEDENLDVIQHNYKCIYPCSNQASFERNLRYVLKWLEDRSKWPVERIMRRNEYALLPHEEDPEYVLKTNFRISMLKGKVVSILLELLDINENSLDKVFYAIHTELSPDVIWLNFSLQDTLFKRYHQGKYRTHLLEKTQQGLEKVKDSYFVIEVGFLLFSLLYKIKEYYKQGRSDPLYADKLLRVMPSEVRQDTAVSEIWVFQVIELFEDIITRIKRAWKGNYKLDFETIEQNSTKDDKVKEYMRFYANTSSQIDILMDQKLVSYTFPILLFWRLTSEQHKEEFLDKIDRSSAQTKCESLVEAAPFLIKEMKIDYTMKNKSWEVVKVLLKFNSLWQKTLWISIVVLNILVLISYNSDNDDGTTDPQLSNLSIIGTKSLLYILGAVVWLFWVLVSLPIFFSNLWMTAFRFKHKKQLTRSNADLYLQPDKTNKLQKFKFKTINFLNYIQRLLQELVDPVFWCLIICGVFIILGFTLHPTYSAFLVIYLIVMSPSMNHCWQLYGSQKYRSSAPSSCWSS